MVGSTLSGRNDMLLEEDNCCKQDVWLKKTITNVAIQEAAERFKQLNPEPMPAEGVDPDFE